MKRKNNINALKILWMMVLLFIFALSVSFCDSEDNGEPNPAALPVEAVVVNGELSGSEGITFNSENRLFVSGESKVWEVMSDFSLQMVYESSNPSLVGLAADENGNVYVADMGPVNLPGGPNDGQVIKITSTGESSVYATDIPDPNFILLRPDGSMLVSDDYDHYIYSVPAGGGAATVWLDSIVAPNGMIYSLDQTSIYVCQTFVNAGSLIPADNRVWEVKLDATGNPEEVVLFATLPSDAWCDGIALDYKGRVYIAANGIGQVWRVNPNTGDQDLVAEDMSFVASLAFGKGAFNHYSIFATQLYGGNIWEIPLKVRGN